MQGVSTWVVFQREALVLLHDTDKLPTSFQAPRILGVANYCSDFTIYSSSFSPHSVIDSAVVLVPFIVSLIAPMRFPTSNSFSHKISSCPASSLSFLPNWALASLWNSRILTAGCRLFQQDFLHCRKELFYHQQTVARCNLCPGKIETFCSSIFPKPKRSYAPLVPFDSQQS